MKKKLQIFISSTYTDLVQERQSAVQAILRSGNIPAGMELFSAGNKSQLDTIKKWIDESDIYMIILGSRYGSLEPESKLSYTEIEYKYALEIGKPLFGIVLKKEFIDKKVKKEGQSIIETDNQDKYKKFKELVLSKVCRICENENEVKLSILESIIDLQNEYELSGWVKASEITDNSVFINEIEIIRDEKNELQKKIKQLEASKNKRTENIGEYTFEELTNILTNKTITVPAKLSNTAEDKKINALSLFRSNSSILVSGVTDSFTNEKEKFFTNNLIPILLNFGLVERQKVKNASMKIEYDKFIISDLGNKLLALMHLKELKK